MSEHPPVHPDLPTVVAPRDRAHLQELIEQLLKELAGLDAEPDEDGDYPIISGEAQIYIRPFDEAVVLELMAPLVVDVKDPAAADEFVLEMNQQSTPFKFARREDVVLMFGYVATVPFVPEHLVVAISHLSEVVEALDDDLDERLKGEYALDPDE